MCKMCYRTLFICAIIFFFTGNGDAQLAEKWNIEHNLELGTYNDDHNEIPLSEEIKGDFNGDSVYSVVSYTVDKSEIIVEVRNGRTGEIEYSINLESNPDSGVKGVFIGDVDDDGLDEFVLHYKMNSVVYEYSSPVSGIQSMNQPIPREIKLEPNYPNPFNPSTMIRFTLPRVSQVKIEIYNILGQRVELLVDQQMTAGTHEVEFTAHNLSSGLYYYRIEAGEFQDVKKMILLK